VTSFWSIENSAGKRVTNKRIAGFLEIVNCCQRLFGCDLPSTLVTLLKQRFEKFIATL